ncbi:PPE domain-containing protein [Nocardia sp. GCM10030253]|uniref:PPE domain-containing protein n=1 Tax=Nocardia sp. GCM10030253 TaxID=3273404 RepID=UPI0036280B8C
MDSLIQGIMHDLAMLGELVDVVDKVQTLAKLPQTFDFLALPPEVNSARLIPISPIPPVFGTAAAYATTAQALKGSAGASDGAVKFMGGGWNGDSSDKAQAAFDRHADWQRRQSVVADKTAAIAMSAGEAYLQAFASMPKLWDVLAVRVAKEAAKADTSMTTLPAVAILEGIYAIMWLEATTAMVVYQAKAFTALAALPAPIDAPPILSGGLGDDMVSKRSPVAVKETGPTPPSSDDKAPDTTKPNGNGDGNGNGNGNNDPTRPDPGDTTPNPGDTNPGPDPSQPVGEGPQAAQDVNNALSSMTDSLGDSSVDGGSPDQHGFYGTSPYSPTLMGLNGGVGSAVTLGMLRGGLGSMPGASTGFRMPANWAPGRGTPFGAAQNNMSSGPASRNTPPRGATAPKANMRRRRRDEERGKSKVFVPGEPEEVPVLEQPPVIGVIEYADSERPDESADEQSVLVGVIEREDDELALAISERPR